MNANALSQRTANEARQALLNLRIALLLVLIVLLALASLSMAQSRRSRATKEFMRDKLELAQHVLEGLATEDYDLIAAKSTKLSAMTQEADWRAFENPDYERYSAEFRRHVDALRKAAETRHLDGATRAYNKMTISCVECHKFVRGKKVAWSEQGRNWEGRE